MAKVVRQCTVNSAQRDSTALCHCEHTAFFFEASHMLSMRRTLLQYCVLSLHTITTLVLHLDHCRMTLERCQSLLRTGPAAILLQPLPVECPLECPKAGKSVDVHLLVPFVIICIQPSTVFLQVCILECHLRIQRKGASLYLLQTNTFSRVHDSDVPESCQCNLAKKAGQSLHRRAKFTNRKLG